MPTKRRARSVTEERTDIDYLILGDFAEVINGKLYLMGGGWSRFGPSTYPAQMKFGLAVGVRVPYLEAETPHKLNVVLRNADGQQFMELEAEFETGRPAGMKGEAQLVPVALNGSVQLEAAAEFEFVASIDGDVRRRHSFKAISRSSGPSLGSSPRGSSLPGS